MASSGHGVVTLRIEPLTSAQGVKEYYRSIQAAYYAGNGKNGVWGGEGAKLLGLSGSVQTRHFEALVDNLNPATIDGTKPEKLTLRNKDNRRVAYDANTHAPKSVSLLCALTGDHRPIAAHHAATLAMMTGMQELAATRVRTNGASEDRPTRNLTWAAFSELVTRPVGGIPDPHLHEHVVIFNATFDGEEKRWKAAQFGEIKRKAPLLQAMFSMNLAREMMALGYDLEWNGPRWEIKGVSADLLKRFSRRTALIEKCAQDRGIHSDAEKAKLGARTREKKSTHSSEELAQLWDARLTADERQLLNTIKQEALVRASMPQSTTNVITPVMAVRSAIEQLSEHASLWTRDELLTASLYAGHGGVDLAQIDAVLEAPEFSTDGPSRLLRQMFKGVEVFTTEQILREEQRCIELARDDRGKFDALGEAPADVVIGDRRLSAEQLAAARQIAASQDFVTCLHGKAGTGKSTLVKAIMPSFEAMGRKVIALAPTHKAVGVLRNDGFDDAMTLSKFLVTAAKQEIPGGSVLWLDEAGLTGMKNMAHFLRIAKSKGCRVVLAGDISQHTAVARGDALRLLVQRAGLNTASVSTIVRQTDADYREAVQHLADGKTDPESPERGLRLLERRGAICTYPDADDRFTEAAKKIASFVGAKKSHLAIAPTHKEIVELTGAVRKELTARGLIETETARDILVVREKKQTLVEKKVAWLYRAGDVIELSRNVPWGKRGQRFTVSHVDSDHVTITDSSGRKSHLNLDGADSFQVYERSAIQLAVGDRIRIGKSSQAGGEFFIGGGIHTIKNFDEQGNMTLDDGMTLPRDFGHLDYGWATTSHASQGMTVDHVVIVQSAASGRAASLEQVYVSASRGKKDVWIFTDDAASLEKAVTRSSERTSALEAFMPVMRPADSVQPKATQTGAAVPSVSPAHEAAHKAGTPKVATGDGYSKAVASLAKLAALNGKIEEPYDASLDSP